MKSIQEKIVKAAGLLLVLQIVEHATGLLKQILIAAWFGASAIMDSYVLATSIAGLILSWVGLPVNQTLIPLFRHDLAQRGERTAWGNVSVLFNTLLLALIFVAVLGAAFAPQLVSIFAPGFQEETSSVTASLIRIVMISVVFVGAGNILSQIFYSYERFFRPGIVGTVNNLAVIGVLLAIGSAYGIYGLAVAAVLGAACESILKLPILWEKRKFYSAKVNLSHPQVAEVGKLGFPLLISTGGFELSRITDRLFASLLAAGSLSALAFAHRPITILLELLVRPLNKATFPHFTKLSAEKDWTTLSRQLFRYVRVVFFVTLPVAIGIMVTAEIIVGMLYQRGAFDANAVRLTSQAMLFYAIGFPAYALARTFRSTFFGLKDAWTPTNIALVCFAIKIGLSWILIRHLAHMGIALADSIAQILNVLLLICFLPKEVKGQEGWKTLASLAQTTAAGIVMAAVVYLVREEVYGLLSPFVELISLVLLGAAAYGVIALLFRGDVSESILRVVADWGAKYLPRSS